MAWAGFIWSVYPRAESKSLSGGPYINIGLYRSMYEYSVLMVYT